MDRNAKIARAALAFLKRFCAVCAKPCESTNPPHCVRTADQYAYKELRALRLAVYKKEK